MKDDVFRRCIERRKSITNFVNGEEQYQRIERRDKVKNVFFIADTIFLARKAFFDIAVGPDLF